MWHNCQPVENSERKHAVFCAKNQEMIKSLTRNNVQDIISFPTVTAAIATFQSEVFIDSIHMYNIKYYLPEVEKKYDPSGLLVGC